MTLKQIYSLNKVSLAASEDKIYLSKNIYNKFITRSFLADNKNFSLLDSSSNFYTVSSSDLKKFNTYSQHNFLGSAVNANNIIYINKFNNFLKFKSFDFNNKVKKFCFIDSLYNLLEQTTKDISNTLLILNPVKGGFTCYSSGVVGFLPRKQGNLLFSSVLSSIDKNTNNKNLFINLNFLLNKNAFIKNIFGIKLPHWWGRTVAYSSFNNNKIFKSTRQKLTTRLSFIFLSQKVFFLNKSVKRLKK